MSGRAQRFPANFPVVLRKGPVMFPATICNISTGGGCIVATHQLAKGETAVLDYAIGQTRATIMWATGNMMGVKFENHLSTVGLNSIRAMKSIA
ncbi:PilZ domain-containing protein [Octadecabacter dasysiphoniae]|nr:PilZ domain-containing protein [Octadecabacter dasysiphoniae]